LGKTKREMKRNNSRTAASLKIILVGEGGQGIQSVAKILSRAAFGQKYHASYIPNFGTEQRGGISLSFVQISHRPIVSPKFKYADLFVIVLNRDIDRILRYISPQTHVLYDTDLLKKSTVGKISQRSQNILPIPAFHEATTTFSERSFNVIILGILTGLVDKKLRRAVITGMDTKFEKYYKKDASLEKMNHAAFETGFKMTRN